jgi:hypothetical protein
MKGLIALLAALGAAAAAVVFLRNRNESWDSTWSTTKDTASSWGQTAADEASKAFETAKNSASSWGDTAADEAGKAADRATAAAGSATDAASNVADEVKGAVDDAR